MARIRTKNRALSGTLNAFRQTRIIDTCGKHTRGQALSPPFNERRLDNTARVLLAPQWRGSERKTALSRALLTPFVKRKLLNISWARRKPARGQALSPPFNGRRLDNTARVLPAPPPAEIGQNRSPSHALLPKPPRDFYVRA